MPTLVRVLLKCLSLSPVAYLIITLFASLIYSSPEQRPQSARIALTSGTLASLFYLTSLVAYRLLSGPGCFQSAKERKWFTVTALPLLTFIPVGLVTAALAISYCQFVKARGTEKANLDV